MKIWVNTIVNNEENFLWFAIMSVVDHVDKVMVWDTGSTDKTVDVAKMLINKFGNKIIFRECGEVDKDEFTKLRQQMLDQSVCDWILILDGDEIWWKDSIKRLVGIINKKGNKIDGIVVPMVVPVGDIYHLQEEKAGQYKLLGRKGHFSLRAINRKIPGLHVDWPYGKESYFDNANRLIQERESVIFLDAPYLHATHLKRSSTKRPYEKFKYELGNRLREGYKYPEVLYQKYPSFIQSPWVKISGIKKMIAKTLTPLRKINRRTRRIL